MRFNATNPLTLVERLGYYEITNIIYSDIAELGEKYNIWPNYDTVDQPILWRTEEEERERIERFFFWSEEVYDVINLFMVHSISFSVLYS